MIGKLLLFSHSVMSSSLWPHGLQHSRLPCPSPSPAICSDSSPLSWWCHPTISSSVIPFSSCLQSFPASWSFPVSRLCIRWPKYWSLSFSISPSNEYSGLISLHDGLVGSPCSPSDSQRVFSNTIVQKHQSFGAHLRSVYYFCWVCMWWGSQGPWPTQEA